jgi:myosin heavy subunit
MDFKHFVTRYSVFSYVCKNSFTTNLKKDSTMANETRSEAHWRLAALNLLNIIAPTDAIFNVLEHVPIFNDIDVFNGLQMGKSQVFLRAPVFEHLELLHTRVVTLIARKLQSLVRMFITVRMKKRVIRGVILLNAAVRGFLIRERLRKIKEDKAARIITHANLFEDTNDNKNNNSNDNSNHNSSSSGNNNNDNNNNKKIISLEKQVKEMLNVNNRVKSEVALLKQQLEESDNKVSKKSEEIIRELESQVSIAESRNMEHEKEIRDLKMQIIVLTEDIKHKNEIIKSLQEQLIQS